MSSKEIKSEITNSCLCIAKELHSTIHSTIHPLQTIVIPKLQDFIDRLQDSIEKQQDTIEKLTSRIAVLESKISLKNDQNDKKSKIRQKYKSASAQKSNTLASKISLSTDHNGTDNDKKFEKIINKSATARKISKSYLEIATAKKKPATIMKETVKSIHVDLQTPIDNMTFDDTCKWIHEKSNLPKKRLHA